MAGMRFGGNRFGGGKYGGKTFGGKKFGRSSMMSEAEASEPVKGTVRDTGVGRTGEKGDDSGSSSKSAKMSATMSPKKSAPKAAPKPEKVAKSSYKAKGVPDYNKQLGDFYLNATSNMFSGKAGGKKK